MDSSIIESIFTDYKVTNVSPSELSKMEFAFTVWKKVRSKDTIELQATAITEAFEADLSKYIFVQIDTIIIEPTRSLIGHPLLQVQQMLFDGFYQFGFSNRHPHYFIIAFGIH